MKAVITLIIIMAISTVIVRYAKATNPEIYPEVFLITCMIGTIIAVLINPPKKSGASQKQKSRTFRSNTIKCLNCGTSIYVDQSGQINCPKCKQPLIITVN